jgi:hypothetical protein
MLIHTCALPFIKRAPFVARQFIKRRYFYTTAKQQLGINKNTGGVSTFASQQHLWRMNNEIQSRRLLKDLTRGLLIGFELCCGCHKVGA